MIRSVSEALAFILDWSERTDIPVPQIESTLDATLHAIASVSDALGPAFYDADGTTACLLEVQDEIFRPGAAPVRDGVSLLAAENQGVWIYGTRPDKPSQLLVSGDWNDRLGTRDPESWRPVDATPQDALVSVLLINAIFALSEMHDTDVTDDFTTIPAETPIPLWTHPAWSDWLGIWTNETNDRLHFGGMGMTLTRRSIRG